MTNGSNMETNQGPETAGSRLEEGAAMVPGVKESCLVLSVSSLVHRGRETDVTKDVWEHLPH